MEVLQSNTADNIYFGLRTEFKATSIRYTNRTVRMKFILSATVNGVCIWVTCFTKSAQVTRL